MVKDETKSDFALTKKNVSIYLWNYAKRMKTQNSLNQNPLNRTAAVVKVLL